MVTGVIIYLLGIVPAYMLLSRAVINGFDFKEWDGGLRYLTCICSLGSWFTAGIGGFFFLLQIYAARKKDWKFFNVYLRPFFRKLEPKKMIDGTEVKDIT